MMHVDAVPDASRPSVPHRLGRRLFVFLFALGLFPLLLGGFIAYQRFSHHITTEVVRTTRAMADGAQMSVAEFLAYVRGRTADIAADWYISDAVERGAPAADLARYLRVQRSLVPESEDVLVLDLHGRVVASSNPDDVGHDASAAAYFRH